MAVKNHALDERIVEAARSQFLAHGFRDASLHKIAAQAGLTTGALYTRYKNKDALFCSLLQPLLDESRAQSPALGGLYERARESRDPADLLRAIRADMAVYQQLLFTHREDCILLFCRSDGSSIGSMLEEMTARKAAGTRAFFAEVTGGVLDPDGVELLMHAQFDCFRRILERDYSREKTVRCLDTVGRYMAAGWEALFAAAT